jgi:hypothetical protein
MGQSRPAEAADRFDLSFDESALNFGSDNRD